MKITIFPSKYHQNCGFSMAMLVYRRVTFHQLDPASSNFFLGVVPGLESLSKLKSKEPASKVLSQPRTTSSGWRRCGRHRFPLALRGVCFCGLETKRYLLLTYLFYWGITPNKSLGRNIDSSGQNMFHHATSFLTLDTILEGRDRCPPIIV